MKEVCMVKSVIIELEIIYIHIAILQCIMATADGRKEGCKNFLKIIYHFRYALRVKEIVR